MLVWVSRYRKFSAWRRLLGDVAEDALTLWHVCRHPATPAYIKVLAAFIAGYLLSPLDLIPEALVLLGVLDDLVLVPVAVRFVLRRVPEPVRTECREKARRTRAGW